MQQYNLRYLNQENASAIQEAQTLKSLPSSKSPWMCAEPFFDLASPDLRCLRPLALPFCSLFHMACMRLA